ncbi:MAG: M20/M25/M40 family metallo-hydrolase [Acidobacteria bacterium]|nr:MAG: M20/M25/M40 family metallo-hydrolase [Acidobacteriota bacterium]REK03850.1 MAG: M20/M25/M40 family metallo-hydrolase [Acidobacteriota bacterium]
MGRTMKSQQGLAPVLAALLLAGSPTASASSGMEALRDQVREYRRQHEVEIVRELAELVSMPNFAGDAEQIRRNAEHLVAMLERRGVRARLLEAAGSPPAVYGELPGPPGDDVPTVVLYAHYDGQPVDPERWSAPPYDARLLAAPLGSGEAREIDLDAQPPPRLDPEMRLYARSTSDDKGPIVAMLRALDALRAHGREPAVDLKFFFEGEEERGSPHLREMLEQHRDLLAADLWLFCDGPVHQSRRQQVVFGVRGVMGFGLTVHGPNRPLHSGHYGNWAPNPGALLANLIASMRDDDGRILIEGFYEDVRPLDDADRAALAAVPPVDEELRRELGLAWSEAGNAPLVERILLPALNVQGLRLGQVGEQAQNTIQSTAQAAIGIRLVPDLDPAEVRRLVERHIASQGFHIVHAPPDQATRERHARIVEVSWDDGYRALRTPLDARASRALLAVVDEVLGEPAIRMPILGGSLPLYLFEEVLRTPLIVLPIANHDNNQHAPDENLRLQNLWDGIELYAAVMAAYGDAWRSAAP